MYKQFCESRNHGRILDYHKNPSISPKSLRLFGPYIRGLRGAFCVSIYVSRPKAIIVLFLGKKDLSLRENHHFLAL